MSTGVPQVPSLRKKVVVLVPIEIPRFKASEALVSLKIIASPVAGVITVLVIAPALEISP